MTHPPHDDSSPDAVQLARHRHGQAGRRPAAMATSEVRLRLFICHKCGTTERVPWCGESPDCGHLDCIGALEKCGCPSRSLRPSKVPRAGEPGADR
jgi:hypothetical protein